MSKRDALRILQGRLSERLQSARTQGTSAAWLAVQARDKRYLLPLSHSGEIFAWTPPQRVPYTRPWFLGVSNLRGALYGVADLAAYLSEATGSPNAGPSPVKADSRLVALNNVLEVNCALLVDRLLGLKHVDSFARSDSVEPGGAACLSARFTDPQGQTWQEINLQELSRQGDFLTIGV